VARDTSVYWVVVVTSPGEKVLLEGAETGVIRPYSKRFEFRGESAEADAMDCRRKAKAAGMEARLTKSKAVHAVDAGAV
jgi:hypothetical protein